MNDDCSDEQEGVERFRLQSHDFVAVDGLDMRRPQREQLDDADSELSNDFHRIHDERANQSVIVLPYVVPCHEGDKAKSECCEDDR